jgi:abnormal spindle-like microcephaly-associated protein
MNALLDSPCPSGNKPWLGRRQQYQSNDPWNDGTLDDFENTAAIDFTTEIRIPSLAREKPRRAHSKTSFAIHDDSKQNTTFTSSSVTRNNTLKRKTQDGRSSLLAQPAQRFQRPRVSTAGRSPTENPNAGRKGTSGQQSGNFERRQSYQKAVESTSASTTSENDVLKKDVRRETVYIPTEDTTMPAVFMKLFSPLKSNQINANGSNPVDNTASISSLEARIAAKRKARTSTSTAPKRAPLQEATKVPQQSAIHKNIFGKNGGKENIPPGYIVGDGTKFNTKGEGFPVFEMPTKKSLKTVHKTETRSSNQVEKAKKPVLKATKANSSIVSMKTADQQKTKKITPKIHGKASIIGLKNSGAENSRSSGSIVRNKLSISQIRPMTIDQRYPLLDNDITNPMMYEENWLLHQEIVITQLVNGLFDSANGKLDAGNSDVLRHELLQIYQSDAFLLLYKRLHASILYGALAPPKEALRRGSRLSDDIGMKRTFLNFWTETYDLHALRAASEVIIGRRISPSAQINGRLSESLTKKHKGLKRTLETFLETFLIRNEDKEQPAASQDEVPGWLYRHTVLRSILIIILLDSGRLTPRTSLPKRLFATSSPHKSSTAALQALANQLLPSTGDIMRPLNHLDCQLCYKQHDLQDYEFHINNLAVDLRDGVILTRLAELFLYPSALQLSSGLELDTTTSMTETLASGGMKAEDEWPLSQNLKLPCTSRATKIFNTQIALMALGESKEMKNATKDICAEDIVDGHREKTISLLWGLVGKWGLTQLIDWDDVRNEITRLQKKIYLHPDSAGQEGERLPNVGSVSHKEMLVRWASILGQLKGLQVDNLSTSFADGRIFESIIDEYEGYLTGEQKVNHHLSPKSIADKKSSLQDRGLEARLRSLGCSSQFGKSNIDDSTSIFQLLTLPSFSCSTAFYWVSHS